MPFGVPMIWMNPQVHNPAECYACASLAANRITGKKQKRNTAFIRIATAPLKSDYSNYYRKTYCVRFENNFFGKKTRAIFEAEYYLPSTSLVYNIPMMAGILIR